MDFLNTRVDNLSMEEALTKIEQLIAQNKNAYVVTPNVDHIVVMERDKEFAQLYREADLILTDGKPLIWISKLYGTPIKEKISGSDFFPQMCALAARKGYSVFILGAGPGVADKAARNLQSKYPGLEIAGTYSPPVGFEEDQEQLQKIAELIRQANPTILAVSLGSPKGEKFLYRHKDEYNVPLSISIGATIDFEAGNVKRAPKWMSNCGLEWMYRMMKEPKRLVKRYAVDAVQIAPIVWKYRKRK